MLRKFAFFLSFLFLTSSVGFAQETARSLYDQGKYQEALDLLQKRGLSTSADFYNAANCLYRIGKVGQALAYYEKANAMSPGNADIKFNLNLAKETLAQSGGLPRDQSFWFGTFVPIARQIPEAFVDILLAVVTAALALLAHRARKEKLSFQKTFLQPNFLLVFGLWALVGALTAGVVMAHRARIAAVVADVGVARSGPNETFTELFKLPAGSKVELTGESRDGWQQVRFSLGNVGWIGDKDLLAL